MAGENRTLLQAAEQDGYTVQDGKYMPVLIVRPHPKVPRLVGLELDGHAYAFDARSLLIAVGKAAKEGGR